MTNDRRCVACGGATVCLGQVGVRAIFAFQGDTPDGVKLSFPSWDEQPVECRCPVSVLRCSNCGRLEMYDFNFLLPEDEGQGEQRSDRSLGTR